MSDSTIACLLVTSFPIKAERRRYPALRGEPLVIVESVGPTDLVLECSPEAQGVEAGIPLAEALSRCPEAFVLPSDRRFYDDVYDKMVDRLAMRCPSVEKAALGCLFAGLEGMAPSYCGEARLIASLLQIAPPDFGLRVGVASHRLAAWVSAAASRPGRAAKAPPATAASLDSSFIELLPLSQRSRDRLHRTGVHTLRQLAEMPLGVVRAHLGEEIRRAWELAQAMVSEPIRQSLRAA